MDAESKQVTAKSKNEAAPRSLPEELRSYASRADGDAKTGGWDERFLWESLIPRLLSPVRVAIIEAIRCIGRPLTANDLAMMFFRPDYYLARMDYHLKAMAKHGALEKIESRSVRGAKEHYYFFPAGS